MTSLLTLEETVQIELSLREYCEPDKYDLSLSDFARAIEAAVIRKLSAGVSVEPDITLEWDGWANCWKASSLKDCMARSEDDRWIGYTLDQLDTAIAAARVQENARCAAHCNGERNQFPILASEIRALLKKEPNHG